MAFKISYSFVAQDKFSSVVAKMNKEVAKFQNTIKNVNKGLKVNADAGHKGAKNYKKLNSLLGSFNKKTRASIVDTKKATDGIKKSKKAYKSFSSVVGHLADKFGMAAYFRLMNLALPLGIVTKLGLDFSSTLNRANANMISLFGNSKKQMAVVQQIRQQAASYARESGYSKADIMGAAAEVASRTGNIAAARASLKPIMTLARAQAISLAAATNEILGGLRTGRIAGTSIMLYGTQTNRFKQAMLKIQTLYSQTAKILSKSPTVQLSRIGSSFQESFGTLMNTVAPALKTIADSLNEIIPPMISFIKKHKELIKILALVTIGAVAWTAALTALGATLTVVSFVVTGLSVPLKALKMLFIGIKAPVMIFNALLDANPIALVVTGIVALSTAIVELINHWKTLSKVISHVWSKFKAGIPHFGGIGESHFLPSNYTNPLNKIIPLGIKGPATANPDGTSSDATINVHIHDQGRHVKSVTSNSPTAKVHTSLHQPFSLQELGLNMGIF